MRDEDEVETAATPVASGVRRLVGTVVAERYRLTGVLGQGALANVYRATDDRLDREVAVKLFHPGQDAAVRSRFAAEAQALARLSHPGLVGIYDAGVYDAGAEGDRSYLVMQLVDGESLRERLLAGPLDADTVALLGARLAMALGHVHGNDVVHRDVKPSNIVLDGNGSPHLADFGIALLLDTARMTSSNEIMGTAAYLSPEQILGVPVGAPADIYSLGLVLLECLTGELEYPGVSRVESAVARLHRSPRVPDTVPPVLAELLTAMTSREPEDRPTAGDCAAWFWAVRDHSGVTTKAVRLAAVRWLSTKGRQLGRSRAWVPLFSGWRRFAIAGSGLAMAVLASTWLFTSLLPKVMPAPPVDSAIIPQQTVSHAPAPGVDDGGPALHIAAVVTTTDSPPRSGSSATSVTGTRAVITGAPTEVVIVTTLDPSVPPPATGSSSTPPNELQDSSVDDGPGSVAPTSTSDSPSTTPDPTTTDDTGQGDTDQGGGNQGGGNQGGGNQGPGGPSSSESVTGSPELQESGAPTDRSHVIVPSAPVVMPTTPEGAVPTSPADVQTSPDLAPSSPDLVPATSGTDQPVIEEPGSAPELWPWFRNWRR
jgi:serine/threonine protein kinase